MPSTISEWGGGGRAFIPHEFTNFLSARSHRQTPSVRAVNDQEQRGPARDKKTARWSKLEKISLTTDKSVIVLINLTESDDATKNHFYSRSLLSCHEADRFETLLSLAPSQRQTFILILYTVEPMNFINI